MRRFLPLLLCCWLLTPQTDDAQAKAAPPLSYTSLNVQIANCETFFAGDVEAYPAVLVSELRDLYNYALALVSDPTVTQSQIRVCYYQLKGKLAELEAAEGYELDDSYALEGAYDTDRGFVHPGLLHTQEDLDRIRQQLEEGDDFVTAAYKLLSGNEWAQSGTAVGAATTVNRGGDDENYINASRAACGAYMNALRWQLGDGEAYAKNAVSILNDWASTCTLVTGDSNWALAAGLTGYQFANAAELLRDYEGWDEADFQAFLSWMLRVWYEPNMKFLRVRNGTWENTVAYKGLCPGHYWSNWGLCNVLSAMSIGILCDDPFLYNQAVSFYKYNHFEGDDAWPDNIIDSVIYDQGLNDFIGMLVPITFDDERGPFGQLGQMQETGRDQGHAQMALGLAVDICQTAYNQGDDLWAYMDNRIAAGIEWQQAFNTLDEDSCASLPWMNFHYRSCRYMYYDSSSWLMTGPSYSSRPTLRPFNERILGYYEGIKGISMPFTTQARDDLGYEVGGKGSTSGGYDHLGLTTLTCHRPAIDPSMASATLLGSIVYEGDTLTEQTELGGLKATYERAACTAIPAGSEVTLIAQEPDSLSGTGSWLWSTGETTSSITVYPTRSQRYVATYTNAAGVESTAAFSIAIVGDCRPDSVTPSMTAEDASTVTTDTLTVLAGTSVFMQGSAWSSDWGSWEWETGSEKDTLTATFVIESRDYRLCYTNVGGAQTITTFHIEVVPMEATVQVDSNEIMTTNIVSAFAGQTVRLIPNTTDIYAVGTWTWYISTDDGLVATGDTTQTLTLDSLSTHAVYTVVHTFGNLTDTLTFTVYAATAANLPDGNYHILDAEDADSYLGIYSTLIPRFMAYEADDHDQFVWVVERDTLLDRYKISSLYSGRFLNAASSTVHLTLPSSYKSDNHTYSLWVGAEEDCYAMQNSPTYEETFFYIDEEGQMCTDGTTISGFPFRFVPAEASTGIRAVSLPAAEGSATYYSLSGIQRSTPQPGINIVRSTTEDGRVQAEKVLVK